MIYVKYLWYVIKHRWFVMIECFKVGLIWRGLVHDLDKFRPDEFFPYAHHFYGNIKKGRDKTGYYKPTNTGDPDFDYAWFLHQKRNDHHWQWWIMPDDTEGSVILSMSYSAIIEMICDWVGAGKAQGHFSPKNDKYAETRKWYSVNKNRMQLESITRSIVENTIGFSK